jgi:hypothetical protein
MFLTAFTGIKYEMAHLMQKKTSKVQAPWIFLLTSNEEISNIVLIVYDSQVH